MYKKYIYIIPFVCMLFPYSVTACNSEAVSLKLGELGLSPTTQYYGNLLANIEIEYGKKFADELSRKHRYLIENPTGKIDMKTLEWVEYIGFSTLHSPGVSFSFAPFLDGDYGASLFLKDMLFRSYPVFYSRPAFLSNEQLNAVRNIFYDDGNYKAALSMFMRQYASISEANALDIVKNIYEQIIINKNYIIGDNMSKIKGATIRILGHGLPGYPAVSCSNVWVNYFEIIHIIKNSGVPGDVNIRLETCHAGNGNKDKEGIKKTAEELMDLFIKRKIPTLMGDVRESYGYKFSKEIYKAWPEFKGSVKGYYGMSYTKTFDGFMRDPSNPNKLVVKKMSAIGFNDVNKGKILFDRAEMIFEYNRKDF